MQLIKQPGRPMCLSTTWVSTLNHGKLREGLPYIMFLQTLALENLSPLWRSMKMAKFRGVRGLRRKMKKQRLDRNCKIRAKLLVLAMAIIMLIFFLASTRTAWAAPSTKSKFYDFSDQLIDGEIKRPTALYMDTRQEVKFQRLLKLKRNFLGPYLNKTARDRVFK